ncbi:MAG: sodium-dependent transporter [Ruminococcaceae bacterium]|nr:sodium-dependent transporter [Oscillospiraceae bacterium]
MEREKFSSRLGFILISAGCAIGLGNVYRFPIITGAYGGALFVLIYLGFLLLLGIPVMCAELSVGRASQRSIASSFQQLEKPGQKWHLMQYLGIGGNYLLMMCYTTIAGWMLIYFGKYLSGDIFSVGTDVSALGAHFGGTVGNTWLILGSTLATIALCLLICSLGLQKGVERITKYMMIALLVLIIGLAAYCCTLSGAGRGLKFYLIPSAEGMKNTNVGTVITAAMGQAFFTLSVGIGSIAIFGSYISKERSLLGEAVTITALDTFIAIASGFIIFPACFTFTGGVNVNASTVDPSFLFTTLSSIFNHMGPVTGRIVGTLFFLFMIFAAYSTVIAVFENIISFWLEKTKLSRRTVCLINLGLIFVLSLPAIFSKSIWEQIKIPKIGGFLDIEDFVVSNLLLPIGSMVYVLFCTSRYGWGRENFQKEINAGKGLKFPKWLCVYMTYVLPIVIFGLLVYSLVGKFI